jgi:Bacterial Ig-like domain (group 1)/Bacterial Ig-like domain (group 2)
MSESIPRSKLPVNGRVVTKATSSFAKTLSSLAALVSVLSFMRAYGVIGDDAAHLTVGDIGAVWIGISPVADTAEALNDTIQLAAIIKDKSGSALVGASLKWSSDHPEIASVSAGGEVIAHAPGTTTVTASVGSLVARSRVVVRPFVASVRVGGDSDIVLRDGEQRVISARAVDRRGYPIPGHVATWRTTDTAIVTLDSTGLSTALRPGRAVLEATIAGVRTQTAVTVIPTPFAVRVVSGDHQRAPARGALPLPVVVRVVSRHGLPVAGARILFRPEHGDGSAEPDTTTSDTEGRAKTLWRLGPIPGSRRLLVLAEGVDSALAITADAEPVAAETRVVALDTAQHADIGAKLATTVGIRVTDTAGRPLSEIPVSWVALDGGTFTPLAPRTDSLGEVRVEWTLSNRAGMQRLRAQVGTTRAVPPLVLLATAKAGSPSTAWIVGGNTQTGTVGAPLAKKVAIKVLDRAGNAVSGAVVYFAPVRGAVADSAIMADTSGIARAVWTLDREPGAHSMSVRVEGVPRPLIVTAAAKAGAASAIELTPRQAIGTPGTALTDGVEARVTDEFGNVVKGATVTFKASSGVLSPARVVTDDKGRARTRWTLGRDAVEQSLVARVLGSGASATLAARVSIPGSDGSVKKPAVSKPAKAPAKPPARSSTKATKRSR